MSFQVLDPGLATRMVDFGRPATRSLGVPVGGAADQAALALGNALAGNPLNAPALEICLKGPVLRADVRVGCVLFGAPFRLTSSRQLLAAGVTFTMEPGEEIHLGGTDQGMRAYFCVRGAFKTPAILGSFSGLEVIKAGETLACQAASLHRRFFPPAVREFLENDRFLLRVVPGLQADWFEDMSFFHQEFRVTPDLDRMGIRLQGRPLEIPACELVSEPVCPGAVQVTRDGQCIVLGVDGQTIGGYPKVAQVIQADLDLLGQLRPGDSIRFHKVDLSDSLALFRQRQAFIRAWGRRACLSLAGW